MKKAAKEEPLTEPVKSKDETKKIPNVYPAQIIRTKGGAELVVEKAVSGKDYLLILTGLADGNRIALSIEGAEALRALIEEWFQELKAFYWSGSFR